MGKFKYFTNLNCWAIEGDDFPNPIPMISRLRQALRQGSTAAGPSKRCSWSRAKPLGLTTRSEVRLIEWDLVVV